MRLKILSYNIHKGFDWKNKHYFIQEVKDFIQSSQADLVFLQEVVGKNIKYEQRGRIDVQFEYLADQLWPYFSYGRNAVYDHGHHGNLILSKFPIESYENIDISTNGHEKRGLLVCKIVLPDTVKTEQNFLYAASSHLNLFHRGRIRQYQTIKQHLEKKNGPHQVPVIVAGDFNDWNKKSAQVFEKELGMQETYKTLHGTFPKTFPAFFPFLCLDRIYVKDLEIKTSTVLTPKKIHRPFAHLSDHLPLFCEVEVS